MRPLSSWFLCLQALADPYFQGLANVEREPSTQPISKLEFEFDRRKLAKDDVRELIYREVQSLCLWKIIILTIYSSPLLIITNFPFEIIRFWSITQKCFRSIFEVENRLASCTQGQTLVSDLGPSSYFSLAI